MMSNLPSLSVIFAGGGTGGHLFPAIAIANRLSERLADSHQLDIRFVGTKRGIEFRRKDQLGYPLHVVNIRGIARGFNLSNLLVPFAILQSLLQTRSLFNKVKPAMVVGTGGYVAWPILKTAGWRGVPSVIQEQNSFPGIVTRQFAGQCQRVYLGFEDAKSHLPQDAKTVLTGNPVRHGLAGGNREDALKAHGLDPQKKTILILGGSQGARAVNQAIVAGLKSGNFPEDFQLMWQIGKRDYKDVVSEVGMEAKRHALFPFAEDMQAVYATADVAIARAGALTLAELEACAVPSVLIPYPFAAGDHQKKNAKSYADLGKAEVVDQGNLDSVDILAHAVSMVCDGRVAEMHEKMKRQNAGKKPALDVIVDDIIKLLRERQEAVLAS